MMGILATMYLRSLTRLIPRIKSLKNYYQMTDSFTPLEQNVNVAHLLYARHKSTPTSQQKNRSRSLFPTLKDSQQIVRFDQDTVTPTHPPSASTQFVVTTLRGRSNMVSTVDTRRTNLQAQNAAFEQHFKKQTHLNHEKVQSHSTHEQVHPAFQPAGTVPPQGIITNTTRSQEPDHAPAGSLLDLKVIETWINDMLVEAEFTNADPKTKHSALKKYGVDRKTLRTKGLAQREVDRVFRCLFVYSFGFYEMLLDILSHSSDTNVLMAQIWKVFGVLLEYCSRGDFKSTVNELEKEKRSQLERMETLLEEKEKQLQAIEVRERDRHSKLLEDVTHLQQQRDMLLIEKTQIEEDFKQADMAFNDEVALRLKFEYRINEIHGIHRELVAKHNKLLDDIIVARKHVERLEKELQSTKRQVEVLVVEKRGLESEINNLRIQLDNLQMAIKGKDQQIRELDVKVAVMRKQENKDYVDRKEYEHSQQTLQLKITNLEGGLQAGKQRESELSAQCNELEQLKVRQLKRIKEVDQEAQEYQKLYHESNSKLQHTMKLEKKLREQCEILRKEKMDLDQLKDTIASERKSLEVDLQFMTQKADIQEREIAMLNQNIQQMKNIKGQLDDEYMRERVKVESLLGSVASKEDIIVELEKCLSFSQQRLHSVTTELQESELSMRLREDDFRVQITSIQKKMDFMDICLMGERAELQVEREKFVKVENELDSLRSEMADVRSQMKNEIFEKNNLQTKAIFMSRVIDSERQRNSELLLELTQLKIENETVARENKGLKVINMEQMELHHEEINQLKQKFERQLDESRLYLREMTFKMYYEDALSNLLREQLDLRQAREQNYRLYQMLDEREKKISRIESERQQLLEAVEQYKVSQLSNVTNLDKATATVEMQKGELNSLAQLYARCDLELNETALKLQSAQQLIETQNEQMEEAQLQIEKMKILNKRLRRDTLLEKAKRKDLYTPGGTQRPRVSSQSRRVPTSESEHRLSLGMSEQDENEDSGYERNDHLSKSRDIHRSGETAVVRQSKDVPPSQANEGGRQREVDGRSKEVHSNVEGRLQVVVKGGDDRRPGTNVNNHPKGSGVLRNEQQSQSKKQDRLVEDEIIEKEQNDQNGVQQYKGRDSQFNQQNNVQSKQQRISQADKKQPKEANRVAQSNRVGRGNQLGLPGSTNPDDEGISRPSRHQEAKSPLQPRTPSMNSEEEDNLLNESLENEGQDPQATVSLESQMVMDGQWPGETDPSSLQRGNASQLNSQPVAPASSISEMNGISLRSEEPQGLPRGSISSSQAKRTQAKRGSLYKPSGKSTTRRKQTKTTKRPPNAEEDNNNSDHSQSGDNDVTKRAEGGTKVSRSGQYVVSRKERDKSMLDDQYRSRVVDDGINGDIADMNVVEQQGRAQTSSETQRQTQVPRAKTQTGQNTQIGSQPGQDSNKSRSDYQESNPRTPLVEYQSNLIEEQDETVADEKYYQTQPRGNEGQSRNGHQTQSKDGSRKMNESKPATQNKSRQSMVADPRKQQNQANQQNQKSGSSKQRQQQSDQQRDSSREPSREKRERRESRPKQDLREFGRLYQIASTHYQL